MTTNPYANFGYSVLTAQRDRGPDRIALVHGTVSISYKDLDDDVNRVANALLAAGIKPGARVATLLSSTLSVAKIYLAQNKIGSVLCALNPYWDEPTLQAIVAEIEATAFVYDSEFDAVVDRLRPHFPLIEQWVRTGAAAEAVESATDLDGLTAKASVDAPHLGASGSDPLALFFTSGSTGLPKAVIYTHASGLAVARDLWVDVPTGQDGSLGTGPIIWGVGFIAVAAPALAAGLRLVLEENFGPEQFLETVPREKITHISVTPSFFGELLSDDRHRGIDLTSLRVAMLGGEPLLPALQERIHERLPQLDLYGYYGQTEAPYSVIGRAGDDDVAGGAVGRARFGGAVRVVDGGGQPVVDQVGEIQIRGPHVTVGYANRPEATEQALVDGWFIGGDVGSIDQKGRVTVLGRRADAIERDGAMTLPTQIEDVASRVPGVLEAGAVGIGDDTGRTHILLVISIRGDQEAVIAHVERRLDESLPGAARPDRIVVADSLPHAVDGSGGRGKLLRRKLIEDYSNVFAATSGRR
ncbi:class I adenylate-forming enzyme family protein [Williamsia soli]|uniref:class I adenylate-forming enzyme family protein n=1 Tax=Williamsia soli TaxID=364929 RepID=UPI001A9F2960|nr:class I adenylate-forming enzyme family protein [Williamsia soli]